MNERFGKRSVTFAAEGTSREENETETGQPWAMRRARKSPAYTARWGELPEARLG